MFPLPVPVSFDYTAPGGTVYKGTSSVVQGKFTATFIVPKDVVNADTTARSRLAGYCSTGNSDGAAYTANVNISGTDTTAVNNGKGPSMSIYLGGRNFRPGDVVGENPVMYVDLSDSSGINASGSGIGHRIEAWVNNSTQSVDLTSYYVGKLDDFRQGTVQFQMENLPTGPNTVKVRAWDSFNNSATGETNFEVAGSEQLQIFDVMNYPNPFSGGTSFTFRQNQTGPLEVVVRIYTIAGRLIQTLEESAAGDPFVRVAWDGRDRDGSILANGVYLYKVTVNTADRRFTSEAIGKLAIVR